MGILSWVGLFISLIGLFPVYQIVKPFINILKYKSLEISSNYLTYIWIFLVLALILVTVISLRNIVKKELRYPLFFNYAISGQEKKINIEKIIPPNCDICNDNTKMKYHYKVELREVERLDGSIKREVIKKSPAFICTRNSDHYIKIDPTVDRSSNI